MMNEEAMICANEVAANLGSVRALLDAVDNYMVGLMKSPWGAYKPVMDYSGDKIQTLLSIADGILYEAEQTQGKVVRSFYGKAD